MAVNESTGTGEPVAPVAAPTVVTIRRTRGWAFLDLRELWYYRELIYFLTWRLVMVRYKQTAIGAAWAILQPLAMMLAFTIFFKSLVQLPTGNVPYPLFAYAGLLPWQLFSRTLTESTGSLVANQRLITKVYFPRLIVPLAATLAAIVDFGIAAILLVVLMLMYGVTPGPRVILLPFCVVLMLLASLGVGFWLSALNAIYRDVAYTVPFLVQFWLFITPVVYPSSVVPPAWRLLYGINPMVGVIESFRWALLGVGDGPSPMIATSVGVSVVVFVSGVAWFRRSERTFVDVIGSGG